MRSLRFRKRGFTLIELLVVIAIIAILVALLLPAIQQAREAARRTQCRDNLHNIVVALHEYHDIYKSFPMGYIDYDGPPGSPATGSLNVEGWGWSAQMLSQMDQGPLFDDLDVNSRRLDEALATDPANVSELCRTPLEVFRCPSDPGGDNGDYLASQDRHFGGGVGTTAGSLGNWVPASSNYIGCMGTRDVTDVNPNNGAFQGNKAWSIRDFHDGMSTTFLVGERDIVRCRGGAWVGVRNPRGGGGRGIYTALGHGRAKLNQPNPPVSWNNNVGCGEGFSSMHEGGAFFAIGDGSVKFISENIHFDMSPSNLGLYQRLMNRDDGERVGEF